MIHVGIDDTDMPDTLGTNKHARALAAQLAERYRCALIVRHQLLVDPRVPYTSKNSAAAIVLEESNGQTLGPLIDQVRAFLGQRSAEGSDPGLCVTRLVPEDFTTFGKRCQRDVVTQEDARRLAARHRVHLEGCGGTEDGVIGALAAVGLVACGNDGRVVQIGSWPDDLAGLQDVNTLRERNVEVRCLDTDVPVVSGTVDVGKHLRPNYREGKIVLFVRSEPRGGRASSVWSAVRFT